MKTTVSQALAVLQDQALKKPERTDERVTRLKQIADVRFDYGEMAKRSLGGQWDKLKERERQEFVDLFTEFLTATYVEKMHSYSGEGVTFLTERVEGDHAEVKSIMVGKKTELPILRSSSYEHLLQMLREKIAQFNVTTKSSETSTSSH
jgi:phospholipid transport system substrate-binding protein